MTKRYCKKCGKPTAMVVENTLTKEIISEVPLCKDCLFSGTKFEPTKYQSLFILKIEEPSDPPS